MNKYALIGFMGCGKTSIGPLLARELGLPFLDLDREIEKRTDMKVRDIFTARGEGAFRALEEDILAEISRDNCGCVLSCGGGIIVSQRNRDLLKTAFHTVWIDVPESELFRRLEHQWKERPLLGQRAQQKNARELLRSRHPLYASSSSFQYRWKNGESPVDSARSIVALLQSQAPINAHRS